MPPRPRTVKIEATAQKDGRWVSLSGGITAFLNKVTRGDDLTPHLSLLTKTRGYTPKAAAPGAGTNRWEDKDSLLNVMGLHHFHLGQVVEQNGYVQRTDEVILASVSRNSFDVIGTFNHDVFDNEQPNAMPAERSRLWDIYEDRQRRGALPGALLISGMGGLGISLSGHAVSLVLAAQEYYRCIQSIEPQLHDQAFIQRIYSPTVAPAKPKLEWFFHCLDLGLLDRATSTFHLLKKGPN